MLRSKTWSGALSLGLLLASAGWASADDPPMGMRQDGHDDRGMMWHHGERHPGREMHAGWMQARFKLDLTDQQRTKIRDILQSSRDQMQKTMQDLIGKRQALQKQVQSDKPDEKAIRSAADDLAKAIGDRAVLRSKIRSQVRDVLTDDQRKKLDTLRDLHQEAVNRRLDRWVLEQALGPQHHEHRQGPRPPAPPNAPK